MRPRLRILALAGLAAVAVSVVAGPDWSRVARRLGAGLESLGVELPQAPAQASYRPLALPALPDRGWIVGGPYPEDSLRGRIVALFVFSSTHPAALDALPRAQAWHDAYARFGVRVIGVHAPEFAFASDPAVPRRLWRRLGLTFPLVHDPSLEVLAAIDSRSNDVQVLVADSTGSVQKPRSMRNADVDGAIAEHAIRVLLRARRPDVGFPEDRPLSLVMPGAAAEPVRTVRLGVPSSVRGPLAGLAPGPARPFTAQFRHQVEGPAFVPHPVGWWAPASDGLEAGQGGAANFVAIRYHAARAGVVASPPRGRTAKLWLLQDEAWLPDDALGADVRRDASGATYVLVDEPRLYLVARGDGEHVLKLSPDEAGTELHALTFEPEIPMPLP